MIPGWQFDVWSLLDALPLSAQTGLVVAVWYVLAFGLLPLAEAFSARRRDALALAGLVRYPSSELTIIDHTAKAVGGVRRTSLRMWARTAVIAAVLAVTVALSPDGTWWGCIAFCIVLVVAALIAALRSVSHGATLSKPARAVARRRVVAAALAGVGAFCVGLFPVVVGASSMVAEQLRYEAQQLLLVAGLALWGLARPLSRWVRARLQRPESLDYGPSRPGSSVLLLRAFEDDRLEIDGAGLTDAAIEVVSVSSNVRFEELVAATLSSIGTVITIGEPDEPWRPLGATRLFYDDDEWQAGVERMAATADLIVVLLGRTPGLLWEMERLLGWSLLAKTVFVSPPLPADELTSRWATFRAAVGLAEDASRLGSTFPLLARFDAQGRPIVHVSRVRTAQVYRDALALAAPAAVALGGVALSGPSSDLLGPETEDGALARITSNRHKTEAEETREFLMVFVDIPLLWGALFGVRTDRSVRLLAKDETTGTTRFVDVRVARASDRRKLSWLARRVAPDTLPIVQAALDDPDAAIVVSAFATVPFGFAVIADRADALELLALVVHPFVRRDGRDRELLEALLRGAEELGRPTIRARVPEDRPDRRKTLIALGFVSDPADPSMLTVAVPGVHDRLERN